MILMMIITILCLPPGQLVGPYSSMFVIALNVLVHQPPTPKFKKKESKHSKIILNRVAIAVQSVWNWS